jgi:hypothetical protein
MRLPNAAHERHHWVIERVAPDFKLLDVWGLPAQGGRDDFAGLLEIIASCDPAQWESRTTRALFGLRRLLGRWLRWDDARDALPIPGHTETTLSSRVPKAFRGSATGGELGVAGFAAFRPLYRTDDEWAAEISNETVHGVIHLAWMDQGQGLYSGQMGIYVKARGRLGAVYLALIEPFRHLIVYPAFMREIERAWTARPVAPARPGRAGVR